MGLSLSPARGGRECIYNDWIPAFAGMTEEARIKAIRLPVCVYRFVVIPAQAGIQWLIQYIPA